MISRQTMQEVTLEFADIEAVLIAGLKQKMPTLDEEYPVGDSSVCITVEFVLDGGEDTQNVDSAIVTFSKKL